MKKKRTPKKVGPIVAIKMPTGEVVKDKLPETMTAQMPPLTSIPLPANTTQQEDLTTKGQRRINLIWEYTQAFIAIVVVATAMFAAVWVVVVDRVIQVIPADSSLASAWTIIATAIGLVVGFYFSRTNHAAIGGGGSNAQNTQKYTGR